MTRPPIRWKLHLTSPREHVYRLLATPEGRVAFWAASADEDAAGNIAFAFRGGERYDSRILERTPPARFRCTYFGGSIVTFALEADERGGTIVECVEEGVADAEWLDNYAGWVSVLMNLKSVADHGVDLRSADVTHTWRELFVNV